MDGYHTLDVQVWYGTLQHYVKICFPINMFSSVYISTLTNFQRNIVVIFFKNIKFMDNQGSMVRKDSFRLKVNAKRSSISSENIQKIKNRVVN